MFEKFNKVSAKVRETVSDIWNTEDVVTLQLDDADIISVVDTKGRAVTFYPEESSGA